MESTLIDATRRMRHVFACLPKIFVDAPFKKGALFSMQQFLFASSCCNLQVQATPSAKQFSYIGT